ncbi:acyl carrier protein [Bombilactobacillus bombi]|uniref:Acyl carrier protein n=1 Tax=Bombilactobacillus bombi TaxID=1303590 RepID=A0A3R6XWX1_9LACO|nr:acyl carrier protein [Bombilactobacillus bombi]MCO6541538.1 acyl carrier protein [Lactobacillus sp.]RHW51877.1 acyl carrier protein [Bombilactobacillus bombi]
MTKDEIFEKVKTIIVQQTGISKEKIFLNSNIKNDLNVDSLDIFEVINELEDQFKIRIEDETGIETVGDLVNFVHHQLSIN